MVEIEARAPSRSMPASLAITDSMASSSLAFHLEFASAVTRRKFDSSSSFSAAKAAGVEVTSNTRMPSSSFSAPVSSTLPCSFMRVRPPP